MARRTTRPPRSDGGPHDDERAESANRLRRFPQGRCARRPHRCGRGISGGAQARLQADHRFRAGDRHQEILGADHQEPSARGSAGPPRSRRRQFPAAPDRALDVRGADPRRARRGRRGDADRPRARRADRRPAVSADHCLLPACGEEVTPAGAPWRAIRRAGCRRGRCRRHASGRRRARWRGRGQSRPRPGCALRRDARTA